MKYPIPIKVAIADDHEIFRDGLLMVLNKQPHFKVVGEASNGRELINLVLNHQPDVVLTDIVMPGVDGVQATKEILRQFPAINIVALSMFEDEALIVDMLEAGATGYMVKNADKTEIIEAVESVYKNQPYYCKRTSLKLAKLISKSRFKTNLPEQIELNEKEKEIMRYICMELTNEEISKKMFLSKRTVDGYRSKIMEKLDVKSAAGIVIYAIRNGIYKVPDHPAET